MHLMSSAFHDGETAPRRYTGDGGNIPPSLSWTAPPKGTKSFALVYEGPDAPGDTWHRWAIFDIPPDRRALAGYVLHGHGLIARCIEHLPLNARPSCTAVISAAQDHVLAVTELAGRYAR